MKEELLLLSISNKSMYVYATYGGVFCKRLDDYKEGFQIMPHFPFLKMIMNNLFRPLIKTLSDLEKNVCFLQISNKYENIKISCDWCSICNGITETAKNAIIKNPELIKEIDFDKLKYIDKYLNNILINRKTKVSGQQIEKWCKDTFGYINSSFLLLSRIYLKLEMIELRWCPFKRSKQFYYRNKDARYLKPTPTMVNEIGKILCEHDTITCNNCPKIINENWKYTKSNTKSTFQPLLDYMMEEIEKEKRNPK